MIHSWEGDEKMVEEEEIDAAIELGNLASSFCMQGMYVEAEELRKRHG
ncbi:MAG: hypothetical protein LBV40_08615 [Methanomicrobiales archaeon]|jgi:hypothetical protein|nr:hypothetical protein [Methanomicrobiales archaeon]